MASRLKGMRDSAGEKSGWLEFKAAEESDYIIADRRYMAFERALVYPLCRQDLIQPNHLTYLRFAICLFLVCFNAQLSSLQILFLALVGALSDFVDGALARAASRITRLGMLLDPLADKFLAFTLIYILLVRGAIRPVYLFMMILAEAHIVVFPLFSWLSMRRGGKSGTGEVGSEQGREEFSFNTRDILVGKIKVFFYACGLLGLFLGMGVDSQSIVRTAEWLLLAGIGAGFIALFIYLYRGFRAPPTLY